MFLLQSHGVLYMLTLLYAASKLCRYSLLRCACDTKRLLSKNVEIIRPCQWQNTILLHFSPMPPIHTVSHRHVSSRPSLISAKYPLLGSKVGRDGKSERVPLSHNGAPRVPGMWDACMEQRPALPPPQHDVLPTTSPQVSPMPWMAQLVGIDFFFRESRLRNPPSKIRFSCHVLVEGHDAPIMSKPNHFFACTLCLRGPHARTAFTTIPTPPPLPIQERHRPHRPMPDNGPPRSGDAAGSRR
jgi:hypothetical protein